VRRIIRPVRDFARRKWVARGAFAALAVVLALFAIAARALHGGSLTTRVTEAMSSALNCDVSMDPLKVQLVPSIRVSGAHLEIRLRNRPDLPPFVQVDQFDVDLGLLSIVRRHVDEIHLDGLHVNVPPRVVATLAAATATPGGAPASADRRLFSVDHIVTHDAIVNFVAKKAGGRPLTFDVHNLELLDAGVDAPMRFIAGLTNPVPEGRVYSRGEFGPWDRDDPTLTPVNGAFTLADADLATINGIAGTTSSTGTFKGVLTDLHVEGQSDTPNFSLDLGGKPVALSTTFTVTVDGTNGTTKLDRIEAHLANTTIHVTGSITNLPGPKNHDVELIASVKDGHVEDLMRLAIDSPKPIVTGNVSLVTSLKLPPGQGRPQQRIDAKGSVQLTRAHFTDPEMIEKIADLSRRGLGKKAEETAANVPADFNGEFTLVHGVMTLTKTEVQVPGAVIQVAGTYVLGSEEVDFIGEALLETSLSRAIGGFKSIFLKPFDPLFRKKGAGAVVPIRITGTRPEPKFGVRKGAVFGKGN
jgi:hypothetical protein